MERSESKGRGGLEELEQNIKDAYFLGQSPLYTLHSTT